MGNIQTLEDILGALRRWHLLVLAIVLAGSLATLLFALRIAHSYETAAVIQIETPRVAEDSTRAVAAPTTTQRLQLIEQQLMTRANMIEMIERHGLFTDLAALTLNEKVVLLRQSVRIENVSTGAQPFGGNQTISALIIVARLGTANQAADVANDLAARVLDLSARRQADRARETLEFFALEEKRTGAEISALESEITTFKNSHLDALPDGLENRRDEIGRLRDALNDIERQLMALSRERATLAANTPLRAIERRQMDAIDAQISGLQAQKTPIRERLSIVEASIARAPEVETMLGTFERRLQQLQDRYSVVSLRLAEAETSQRLEANQQSERFELLEPAIPPDYPVSSGRRKIMVFGVFASIAAALGLVLLFELRKPVLRTSGQMMRALDLRPVIAIPVLRSAAELRRDRMMRTLSYALLIAGMIFGLTAVGAFALAA